jgi:cytochrome c-type biogenesis protein CcmH/NrfG/DNA-binding NarL/FixJ family response regulator
MAAPEEDLSVSQAMVIDGNPTSRAILVGQLRDFGVGTVVQCSRLADARRQLEYRAFDMVLCELHFDNDAHSSGQVLLDDLRRNQLLPFSTVFIMVTGEATYAKVAEAAESALDGYLLKPHSAGQLGDRLNAARKRKISLQEIFSAIEVEEFDRAADLCLQRFEARGLFWLYAARIGAELMLRTGKYAQAQTLYEAVAEAKTLPWAKLGVARSMLDAGQAAAASSTLENLIGEDPSYVDAYEVLGRAQFELGRFDRALANYKMACDLTPASVSRLQNLGLMTYYSGNRVEAEKILDKTTRLGLDSKMFDCQTLVLLAFARFESGDRKGLQRCCDDFARVLEKNADVKRLQRLAAVVEALSLIQEHQLARTLDLVRAMCKTVKEPDFDFEAASNLVALMAQLAHKSIQLDEIDHAIETLAMRFCASRALSELLAGAAQVHPPYAERVQAAHLKILKLTEQAMALSMGGDPQAAVESLVGLGATTLNSKLIETAHGVLQRYAASIANAHGLGEAILDLRKRFLKTSPRPALGEQKRPAGGLLLRTGPAGPVTAKAA